VHALLDQEVQYACTFAGRKNKPVNEGESMQRVLMFSASVVAMTWAANAVADSPNLKGAYGFTGTAACLVAPGNSGTGSTANPAGPPGFDPITLRPLAAGNSFSHSNAVEGIRTFNGDGTGTVVGTSVGITVRPTPGPAPVGIPSFPPAAGSAKFKYQFTYTVNGDGSWTATMVPGSYTETFVTGPRAGQTAMVNLPQVTGLISQDGKTLILVADPTIAPPDPNAGAFVPQVETVIYSNGDVDPQICHRSWVLIKLGNGKGGNDD
jgi:hypothetical protein